MIRQIKKAKVSRPLGDSFLDVLPHRPRQIQSQQHQSEEEECEDVESDEDAAAKVLKVSQRVESSAFGTDNVTRQPTQQGVSRTKSRVWGKFHQFGVNFLAV